VCVCGYDQDGDTIDGVDKVIGEGVVEMHLVEQQVFHLTHILLCMCRRMYMYVYLHVQMNDKT